MALNKQLTLSKVKVSILMVLHWFATHTLAECFTPHLPEAKTDLLKQRRGHCATTLNFMNHKRKKKKQELHNAYYGLVAKPVILFLWVCLHRYDSICILK